MKKKIITYAAIVIGFLVIAYGFVPQVLGGKIVNQSDISGYVGMSHEANTWNAEHPDDPALWTGAMFSGMPTTTINVERRGDFTQPIYSALLAGKRPASYLFISLLGAFLLLLAFGVNPWVAMAGAIAVTFCSYNIQIIQVGHNTKMQALAFLPWVLAALVFTYRKALRTDGASAAAGCRSWLPLTILGAALFGLALSFQIKANHPQITYYLAIMVLLYAVVLFVWLVCDKPRRAMLGRFFAASALLLVLGIAGIGTNANKLLPLREYTEFSNRGGSTSGDTKGVDLSYATAWSYGWEELPNLLIPNYNGGASSGAINPDKSEVCKLLRRAGQKNVRQTAKALPFYWGPQPFTAGPMYMGAITVFLFILGLFLYKGKEKWWLIIATVLAILLALGNHLMGFTEFFYKYAPMYNKFRTVSMALVVLQFTLPLLGFLTLDRILKAEIPSDVLLRKGGIAFGITAGFCLLCVMIPAIAGSFSSASDAGMQDILVDALREDRRHLLRADALRSLLLIAAAFGVLVFTSVVPSSAKETFATHPEMGFARRRLGVILIGVLVLADLFVVGKRYLNADDFVTPKQFNGQFTQRPVDEMILADTDPSYRVLDLTVNVFNDSHPSYWHKNIGGYCPAKLQRYQEYVENTLNSEINKVYGALKGVGTIREAQDALPYLPGLASLNCRYIIIGDNQYLEYKYAKGPVWFEEEDVDGYIELESYTPNELRYHYDADASEKVVFSEVYYPVGWTLTVEDSGEVLPISLYGDVLRSAVVPAGEHTLVMRFAPTSYARGAALSRASSLIIILLVLVSAGLVVYK